MGSERSVKVGGVRIGGGAPRRHPVDDAHQDARRAGDDGADRRARERRLRDRARRGAEARGRRGAAAHHALLAAAGHRRHPLQRQPGAQGDRGRRRRGAHQSRQHRRPRQGRRGRHGGARGRHPDADRRELGLAAPSPRGARPGRPGGGARRGRARGGAAARVARLPRLQDLGQVEPRADDDPRLPDARRRASPTRSTSV